MNLNRGERNALRRFSRGDRGYRAVSKWKGIGLPSMRSLVAKGLLVEGQSGIYGPTFKLTDIGLLWRDRLDPGEQPQAACPRSGEVRSRRSMRDEAVLA